MLSPRGNWNDEERIRLGLREVAEKEREIAGSSLRSE